MVARLFVVTTFLGIALPARCALLTLETRQLADAEICVNICSPGSLVRNSSTNSTAHSNNFNGGPNPAPSEARTAARTGSMEIAANATVRHRNGGPFTNYAKVSGEARFEIDIVAIAAGAVYLDFNLPPGFVEVESNAEIRDFATMAARVVAEIQFCTPACSYDSFNPLLFQMVSYLEGNWVSYSLANNANSADPSLDVSPLQHTNVSDVFSQNFIRTITWQYDAFSGRIFLGNFAAGQTFTVSYRMTAETANRAIFGGQSLPAFQTWAAAAINDPFFLSTDPLPQRDLFSFTFVPIEEIPEPATAGLMALGAGLLVLLGRRGAKRL